MVDEADIENVSGKLESFSLSDAIETSLYMQGMTAPAASESRRGESSHNVTGRGLIVSNDNNNDDDRQEVTADSSAGVWVKCGTQGDVQTSLRTG